MYSAAFKPNNDGWGYSQSYSDNFSSIFGKKKKKMGGFVPSWKKKSTDRTPTATEEAVSPETKDIPKDIKDAVAALAPLKEAAPELYTQAVDVLLSKARSS